MGNSRHNLTFVYDRYGNMTCQVNGSTSGLCPQYSFNTSTNQISNTGYVYGGTGHLINDGTHTYQYDAEGRLISVDNGTTASYVYDALGQRVEKDVGGAYSEYVFNIQGLPVGVNNRTNWTEDYIPMSQGRHVAHYAAGAHFMHPDALGTTGIVTSYTGAVEQDELHYPWGQEWKMMGSMKEERYAKLHHRDSATSLDPTHYRLYSSDTGRWMTPDPSSEGSSSPFSPQTWNRYAYVTGNPLKLFDPFGLGSCDNMGYNRGSWCGGDNGGPNCFMDGMYTPCTVVSSAVQNGSAAVCPPSGCSAGLSVGNFSAIAQFNANTNSYQPMTRWTYTPSPDPIYSTFAAMCVNQGCDPFAPQIVRYQFANGVYNVTWNGHTIDPSNLTGYWQDPTTLMHNGTPSWYQGSPFSLFNVIHLIGGSVLTGHEDPYGALNPLHYLLQLPQMLGQAGPMNTATCSFMGGCSPGY